MDEVGWALHDGGGVVCVRDHPRLRHQCYRRVAAGELGTLLPGVFAPAELVADPRTRIAAGSRYDPDAVVTGSAAAASTFWPELTVQEITLSSPHRHRSPVGYRFTREIIPPELVDHVGRVPVTAPALTALDLTPTLGGAGVDTALRQRACTLAAMHQALDLTPGRHGNTIRRRLLHESRDQPWAESERRCHALLHRARITGWNTNVAVLVEGQLYYLDVAFEKHRLAIEIDGYDVHSRFAQFHRDRRRWTELTLAGWTLIHVTWEQIVHDPAWLTGCVRRALRQIGLNSRSDLGAGTRLAS